MERTCIKCGKKHNRDSVWCSSCEGVLVEQGVLKPKAAKKIVKPKKDIKAYRKEYYIKHRDSILLQRVEERKARTEFEIEADNLYYKEYREKNKEAINKRRRTKSKISNIEKKRLRGVIKNIIHGE